MVVLSRRILVLLSLVGPVLLLCTGAAPPPPAPSQVLGQNVLGAAAQRLYSSTARYSLKSTWVMGTEIDGTGSFDRLITGTRFLDIAAFAVAHEPANAALAAAALETVKKAGGTPTRGRIVSIPGPTYPPPHLRDRQSRA